MPRTKKRKQGLVAKLDSKSFGHMSAIILHLAVHLPEDPQTPDGLPDYIKRNLKRGTFNGEVLKCSQDRRGSSTSYADIRIPLGIVDLRSVEDSRWALRRLLAALHLEHLGLEKQLYRRTYLLSQRNAELSDENGVPRNIKHDDPHSHSAPVLSFLTGLHKIVDGVRKPVSAFLREALIANEGTALARQVWATLLAGLVPSSVCVCTNEVDFYRLYRPKTRSTAPKIEAALESLNRTRDRMPIITGVEPTSTEFNLTAGWYLVPKSAVICVPAEGTRISNPRSDESIIAGRQAAAHIKRVDPRRTRLGFMLLPANAGSPSRYDDLRGAEVSPHKALLAVVDMMAASHCLYPNYVCADPYKIIGDLLKLDPKTLSMGMVQRALYRIWPNGCTMPHPANRYGSYRQSFHFLAVQHAKHTT